MGFHIYLPVAGCSVNIALLLGLGGVVGLLSGLFGVGGGFVLTPLLIMIGIPPTVAAASDSNQIVAASASGMLGHYRLGNVDLKMGALLLLGGVAGSTLGVGLMKLLRTLGNADFVILVCYVAMLGLIGGYMFLESLSNLRGAPSARTPARAEAPAARPSVFARAVGSLPFKTEFPRSGVGFSALLPFLLGAVVGVLAAVMGVGGGFLLIPVMVYLLRMPMHVVLGTSLFQIFFTCINVTVMQSYLNRTVDMLLALILLVGSSVGAQAGVRISRRLKADQIKILLSLIVLAVMLCMLGRLVLHPASLLGYGSGHG
ncbi:MAG: sulfite exporter TauE/SafE family protein [Elusimicrobia bacterium]|nr:sulfite exporter TauE/SafE family protein [Elusimicrobiota bacterium]